MIALAREALGLNQSELARRLGVTPQSVQSWESDRNTPRHKRLKEIGDALGVSAAYLMGEMGRPTDFPDEISNVASALAPTRYFMYPEISWVQAGLASEAMDAINLQACPSHASDVWAGDDGFWLRVVGSSMTSQNGASFPEGFLILVAPETEPRSGQYVVARMVDSNEATFKQFVRDAGRFYLRPLNPAFATIAMDSEWEIVGTVVDGKMPKSTFL
ncbi:XRE family transcriptional regulator [Pseudomonas putida]|uniref:LexA family protein n=1 Tax=Pseudomonas putida TaxID=303 RepID=UPI0028DBCA08|nr:XRE family transcriptional regulator [uncultured Pseudomonas sp.]